VLPTMKSKNSRVGFEVEAELVGKVGKKTFRQSFSIKVNSLNPHDIQPVIDYWRQYLTQSGDIRKLVIKKVYKVEAVSDVFYT
jgi:hypothetical protein